MDTWLKQFVPWQSWLSVLLLQALNVPQAPAPLAGAPEPQTQERVNMQTDRHGKKWATAVST